MSWRAGKGKMMKKEKKSKQVYIDDGHTIYSMEQLVGPENYNKKEKKVGLTRKERWVAIKAAYRTYLPILFGVIICFSLAFLLVYFWLK